MKKLILILSITLYFSCNGKTQMGFSLSGTTNSMQDDTVLFLDIGDHNLLDSTIVSDNTFEFKTELPESPVRGVLRTKDFSHYRFIWLEDEPMVFDANNTDFRNAKITGSESESLSQKLNELTKDIEPHSREQREIEQKFINDHPKSIVSANILAIYATTWGKEITQTLFQKLSEDNKNSKYGQKISTYIKLNKEPKIGERFADFEMTNPNGDIKKLSDNLGKLTLLEFWASWCGPCRKENPNLVKTYEKFSPEGFKIFAVSIDQDKKSWLKAIEKDHLIWQHVSDLNGDDNTAGLIYGVNGIPDNFLIDENGLIIGRNLRGEALDKKIEEIIKI